MSRTRRALFTALALIIVSGAVFVTRRATGGTEVGGPAGTSSREVTVTVLGRVPAGKDAPLITSAPPDFRRQHIYDESWQSDELSHRTGRTTTTKSGVARTASWK